MQDVRRVGDRYEIVRELGRGGAGVVHLAYDRRLERHVALKELAALELLGAGADRFLAELSGVETLRHPNIAEVFELFVHDGIPYISMEYFEQGSLRDAMHPAMVADEIAPVLEGVLAALAYAAARGIVHGDLKPENVFLTDQGTVKVADFGVARAIHATQTGGLTATGTTLGTPTYMAPEQAMGKRLDPRTDLYAVGVMAYELAVGRPPFEGETPMAILLQHVNDPPPRARPADPRVRADLPDWIDRLLEKDPNARPADALVAYDELEAVLAPQPEAPKSDLDGLNEDVDVATEFSWLLRDAARAGVVPLGPPKPYPPPAVLAPEPELEPPPAPPEPEPEPELDEGPEVVFEPKPGKSFEWPAPAQRRRLPLLRLAVPLVALGALALAARWLLGLFVDAGEAVAKAMARVQCTVFAPPSAAPGSTLLVQLFVHLPEAADDARAIATELDRQAVRRAFRSLEAPVRDGTRIDFELRLPGLVVDEPTASLVWRGRAEAVQFGVDVPDETPTGTIVGTLTVTVDSVPIGHVKFKLEIAPSATPAQPEPQGEDARRYRFAFISYSSKDRDEVLRRVQLLTAVGIEYFQDVLSLEPGDRWEKRVELGIDRCDLFLLFWSSEAKRSDWVRQEVLHALARKGGDDSLPPEIRPVIVEGPPIVEPWAELAHLHFNDRLLYVLRAPNRDS